MCCAHLNRRQFLGVSTGVVASATLLGAGVPATAAPAWADDRWDPARPFQIPSRPLRVLPVLMYRVAERREQASWKSWGGVQTEAAALEEAQRIQAELRELAGACGFPVEMLPVASVRSVEDARQLRERDATIVYPATGSGETLRACMQDRNTLIFARHRVGPAYYWYEALSTRYLRPDGAPPSSGDPRLLSVLDVVIDDTAELSWRLRAIHGVNNLRGSRIVAVGGAMGKYAPEAPQVARDRYQMDIVDVGYEDLGRRIESALADPGRMRLAARWADAYLALP